ncbi:MAG: hypothetical protein AAFY28_16215, partial [Actinomycetota bacterium]
NLSYDIWGGLVVVPVLAVASIPLVHRAFADELTALRPWVWLGMFVKFAGALAGYNVRFEAYGGAADAGRYHNAGKLIAGDVYEGLATPLSLIPRGTTTLFVENFTGLVYGVSGSSRLGGFMVFAWISFWGLCFFVKAAHHAVPQLATRRYAVLVFLFPSLVYWGSSIGKEALVGFCLGLTAWGAALILTRRGSGWLGLLLTALGLIGAAIVRPHFAAIWAGSIVIALVARFLIDLFRPREDDERRRVQVGTILLVGVAAVGFYVVANVALDFLPSPDEEDLAITDEVTGIFDEVERRTATGGSQIDVVSIDGPWDYPLAITRTLTRPMVIEANSVGELLPALEMTALLGLGLFSWRRLAHAPKMMLTTPYLVFAALCLITFGFAFSSIGNLGILVRQRSLVLPLLLVFWCLPPLVFARERAAEAWRQKRSTLGMPGRPDALAGTAND